MCYSVMGRFLQKKKTAHMTGRILSTEIFLLLGKDVVMKLSGKFLERLACRKEAHLSEAEKADTMKIFVIRERLCGTEIS